MCCKLRIFVVATSLPMPLFNAVVAGAVQLMCASICTSAVLMVTAASIRQLQGHD